jgi:Zn-dependent protease with chaperone function
MKKYNNYIKDNENINESFVVIFAIGLTIIQLLRLLVSYSSSFWISNYHKEPKWIEKIKKITGKEYNIYCHFNSEKNPAFCTGKVIVFSKKFEEILSEREMTAVLLHETSHIDNVDSVKTILLRVFSNIPVIFLGGWLLFLLMNFVKILGVNAFARNYEYYADTRAIKYGYGEELASALVKLRSEYYGFGYRKVEREITKIQTLLDKLLHLFTNHPKLYDRIKYSYEKLTPEEFIKTLKPSPDKELKLLFGDLFKKFNEIKK